MVQVPYEKMVCDSDYGDGGVYFYDEYFEWINRDTGKGFRIRYEDIKDITLIQSQKKKVTVITNSGAQRNLYLYKADSLIRLLQEAMDRVHGVIKEPVAQVPAKDSAEDDISKLERLAKLHESGALTDEEFTAAKKKILGLDQLQEE